MSQTPSTLYHSALSQMGTESENWVICFVKQGPTPSKFSKPGQPKPDFAVLIIDGAERTLTVENPHCGSALAACVGREVQIKATGSRDSARLECADLDGNPIPIPEPAPQAHRPAAAPGARPAAARQPGAAAAPRGVAPGAAARPSPQQSQRIAFSEAQMQSEHLFMEAWRSAARIHQALMGEDGQGLTTEQIQVTAGYLYIGWDKMGFSGQMTPEPLLAPQGDGR